MGDKRNPNHRSIRVHDDTWTRIVVKSDAKFGDTTDEIVRRACGFPPLADEQKEEDSETTG